MPWPLAWSFPVWVCHGCGQHVEWQDALVEDTPEIFTIRHKDCDG